MELVSVIYVYLKTISSFIIFFKKRFEISTIQRIVRRILWEADRFLDPLLFPFFFESWTYAEYEEWNKLNVMGVNKTSNELPDINVLYKGDSVDVP